MKMIYRPIFLMFFFFFQCVHLEVTFIAERLPIQGNRPDPGSPWPMPKYWNKDAKVKTFIPGNIRLTQNRECDVTQEAFNRFVHRLQKVGGLESSTDDSTCFVQTEGSLQELKVVINDQLCPEYPQLGDSEKYELNITDTITIKASQVWGAVWGLETLGQLTYMVDGKWFVNQTFIGDEPRFSHRGLHLDTARHFYSIDVIKLNLDVMAMHKLNVFHWHIVDAQSFPYSSRRYPELAQKGAYSPGHIYSQSDVQDIINFARLRGIRVLPEFDTPGHAQSWGKSHPELLTTCYDGDTPERSVYGKHSEKEIMDPTKNSTFDFLRNFFDEIKDVFKDNFLHMGMDEVHYMCWESSPIIQEFLKDHGIPAGQYSGLETYYSNRLLDIIRPMNKRVVIWEDPVNHGAQIRNDTLIQVWKKKDSPPGTDTWAVHLQDAVRRGFQVIFSSCWYLNYISYGQDWKDYYTCDPYHINATQQEMSQILGGEVCLWSEYIDETNLLSLVWPRASAVAERLWSVQSLNDTDDATFRLDQHRCRMLRHGIPAKPILPGYCRDDYNTDNTLLKTCRTASVRASQETSTTTKNPNRASQETSTTTKNPNRASQETSTTTKNPNRASQETSTTTKNPNAGSQMTSKLFAIMIVYSVLRFHFI